MPIYKVGVRVSQGTYGSGTVVESNARHTVIDFDDHGLHRFITTMVDLSHSTVPAPSKSIKAKARRTS